MHPAEDHHPHDPSAALVTARRIARWMVGWAIACHPSQRRLAALLQKALVGKPMALCQCS